VGVTFEFLAYRRLICQLVKTASASAPLRSLQALSSRKRRTCTAHARCERSASTASGVTEPSNVMTGISCGCSLGFRRRTASALSEGPMAALADSYAAASMLPNGLRSRAASANRSRVASAFAFSARYTLRSSSSEALSTEGPELRVPAAEAVGGVARWPIWLLTRSLSRVLSTQEKPRIITQNRIA
jgi:hypothetical protein